MGWTEDGNVVAVVGEELEAGEESGIAGGTLPMG